MRAVVALCFLVILLGCSTPPPSLSPLSKNAVILAFGDSLTYGSGAISKTQSYPVILQQLTGRNVINAGVPGEVSEQGLKRLSSLLSQHEPELVVICHGGNDILRRLDKTQLKKNIEKMVETIKAEGVEVVLIGVPLFHFGLTVPDLYLDVAEKHQIASDLTVLVEVLSQPRLKSDQVHPNAEGYQMLGHRIFELLQKSGAV